MNVSDVYFDVVAGAEDVLAGNVSPLHHSRVHQGRNHENWKRKSLRMCIDLKAPIFSGSERSESCGEGWEKNGEHCYFWSTEKKNWNDAEDFCQKEGGHLASVGPRPLNTILKRGRTE